MGVRADPFVGDVTGVYFAKNMRIAHAAGNQLGDLGAEVKDEDFLVLHEKQIFKAKKKKGVCCQTPLGRQTA